MGANVKLAESMGTATKTMQEMNKVLRPEKVATDLRNFGEAAMKLEMTDEMSNYTNLFIFN